MPPWVNHASPLRLVALGLMYWAGAEAIYATPGTYAGVWLPAGIYLAWLVRTPPRQWGAVIFTAAVANLLADLVHHQPLWFAGGFLIVNVGVPLAAAALLVRFCRPMLSFAQLQHVMYLGLFAGLLSGPIAALAGTALLVARRGGDFWQDWFLFWIGDLVGLLLAMPLVIGLLDWSARPRLARAREAAALLSSAGLATWLLFRQPSAPAVPPSVLFFFLMWAALRLSSAAVAATALVMLPVSLRLTLEGIGPYSYLPTEPLRVQMVQLLVATGAFLFYILAAVIAERRAAEFQQQQRSERLDEEVQARTEELRAADRRKNEFLAMLAHELRNPLAPIRNVSQLLSRMFRKDADLAKPLAMLDRQTEQLTHLVDDLLDVSRIAQGRIDLTREVLTLSSVVEQAVDMVMPLIREKQHGLEVKQEAGPLLVEGDRARLVQSIGNLLTNATKFTGANGAIELAVRPDGDWVCISVTDNGQGISASLLPRVFDLFVQGERMLDRSQGGLGIGLAVAKRLVEMHGGTVDAASGGEGSGACFTIRLRRLTALPRQAPERPAPTAPARRILIVDDNVDAADSTAMLLRAEGHEVEAVYAAADALRRAAEWRPDAVLLDIGLPHMDGFEVARRLRSNRQLAGIWLVALTGYGQHEDKLQADEAGFDAHLVKPVNLETLAKVLGDTPR